jgi:histidinol-phosphate aminotransferase
MRNLVLIILYLSATAVFAQTETAVNLSLNENPFGVTDEIKARITGELSNINRYAAEDGERFIERIAHHEGVEPEQIIPGEILDLLGIYLGLRGGTESEFIYSVPGYPALVNAAERVGGKIISIPLNNKLENDLPAIEAAVNEKTQAIFLINPHNPSGTVSDKNQFRSFVRRVSKKTLVIVDEAYLEYAGDFEERTLLNNLKSGDNVLIFRTMAKAYGLAGLAMGYAIAPKNLAGYLKERGLGDTHALNRLAMTATESALENRKQLNFVKETVTAEREKWHLLLDSLRLEHSNSLANFVFFNTGQPYETTRQKFAEAGIKISRAFTPYDTWVRITIGTPEENEKAREVLRKLK